MKGTPRPKPKHRHRIESVKTPLREMGIERVERTFAHVDFPVDARKEQARRGRADYSGKHWNQVVRPAVLKRDNYTCQMCGLRDVTGKKLEVDHIVERGDGGSNHPSNLQTLCRSDHASKTHMVRRALGR